MGPPVTIHMMHQPRPVDRSHHSDLAHDQHEFSLIWTDILDFSGVVSLPLSFSYAAKFQVNVISH
jgi:hypothetical protein